MNLSMRKLTLYGCIVLWVFSLLSVMGAGAYLLVSNIADSTADELTRAGVYALGIGFLPWIFAYAGTRVLYGIETIIEG